MIKIVQVKSVKIAWRVIVLIKKILLLKRLKIMVKKFIRIEKVKKFLEKKQESKSKTLKRRIREKIKK